MIYTDRIHLIADDLEELHSFALKIGLKLEWFQDHSWHPHYDLFGSKKDLAIRSGAILVNKRTIVKICRLNYPQSK